MVNGKKVLESVGRYIIVAVGMRSVRMMSHVAPARVLPSESFNWFFTRLRHPEVGSDTEQNSPIGLNYDNLTTTSNLHSDPLRSSSFIDTDLACSPEDPTPTFVFSFLCLIRVAR